MKERATVIIPAYNEENRIGQTISGLRSSCYVDKILVVDDGSQDRTAIVAEKNGAQVLKLETNMGKGHALNTGVNRADGEVVAFIDADVGKSSCEVDKLLHPVLKGEADVVIGIFPPPRKKGGFGLVKKMARHTVSKYTDCQLKAILSGQRAFRKEVLESIGPIPRGYAAEVGMTINILQKGFTIVEVPVNMTHRETGRDLKGFVHRSKQFLDILKLYIKKAGAVK